VSTAIAVVCALAAAFCFALGALVQQGVARQTREGALSVRLLLALARQPRWVAGVALSSFSFVIQGAALAFGPLALVQPLAATDVLFALPLIAIRNRQRLTRKDAAGALTVAAGMAVFIAVSPPVEGLRAPSAIAWIPAFGTVAAAIVVASVAALRTRGNARVMWLAAAAGVIYGLLDAIAKGTVDLLQDRGIAAVITAWEPYALAAAGLLGALFGQSAFNAGPLSLSLPVIDTLEPVAAVVIATTVFRERLASSPGQLAVQLAGGALAVTGIAVLSRSSVVHTESELMPGPTAMAPDRTN
jgi:drug/metabolite transporter (DMT)-like permease